MDISDHIRVSDNRLLVRRRDDTWVEDLEALPGESEEALYTRWVQLCAEKEINDRLDADRQRINNLFSWLIPLMVWTLAYFVSAFFE